MLELDERSGLETLNSRHPSNSRQGLITRLSLADLLRQSVYSRLAGDEDLNDAVRVSAEPTLRFGGESRSWKEFDLAVSARRDSLIVQGGISSGSTSDRDCDLAVDAPSVVFCDTSTAWLTQFEMLGSYALPYDTQVAGTFQSNPGPERSALVRDGNADIAPTLGRNLGSGPASRDQYD